MDNLTPEQKARIQGEFKRLDADNSGYITRQELFTVLKEVFAGVVQVDNKMLDEMMALMDFNGDGKINFEEFVKYSQKSQTKLFSENTSTKSKK